MNQTMDTHLIHRTSRAARLAQCAVLLMAATATAVAQEPVPAGQPMAQPPASPSTPPPAEATPPIAEPAALPLWTDLPYTLRKDLPALKFTMYRWHENPGERFVVYKERRVMEDGVLGQELWVREIHPDHLVLEFRGTLFKVMK